MLNTVDVNLKTDITSGGAVSLPLMIMSQDINNNNFILRFVSGAEQVSLDNTYTVEVLTKFMKSGASRLTSASIHSGYARWSFDTSYITQDEMVYNFVYVRKSGNLVVSADANAFYFQVGLSEIDKDAGRIAEVYDENYEKYLDEFKDNVDFEEIAQAEQARKEAEQARKEAELLRQESYDTKVDTAIVEADVVSKVDNKVTELTPQINDLTAQLTQTMNKPYFQMNNFVAKTGIRNGSSTVGGHSPIGNAFCHTYDHLYKTTGAIYAVEVGFVGRTSQKILRSIDGGVSWDILGEVPVNIDEGEAISRMFVEPVEETIYLLRALDVNVTPVQYRVESYNSSLAKQYGTLDIGSRYWHSSSHNIDARHDWSKATVMFSEYGSSDETELNVWKTIDKGVTWTKVLTKNGLGGVPGTGEIRHFHTLQVDPFTDDWWLSSGDEPVHCQIWKSENDGVTWTLMGEGIEEFRCLGFVFEKDHVYWGMDSTTPGRPVALFKSPKTDLSQRVVIGYQAENYPVYQITKTYFPRGFLIFPQYEPNLEFKGKASIQFYNMDTEKLTVVSSLSFADLSPNSFHGFTGEGSRYQDRINGAILTQMSPHLQLKYRHASGSLSVSGSLICKLSL